MESLGLATMGIGLCFWLWGTAGLFSNRTVLWKLHVIGISDTLGSILLIAGLLVCMRTELPLLLLAILSLAVWGTMLGYVLAHAARGRRP